MKTTIDLTDALFEETKREATRRGTTMRALIEQGLRLVLDQQQPKRFVLKDGAFHGEGLQDGQREGDWDQVQRLMYPMPGDDDE